MCRRQLQLSGNKRSAAHFSVAKGGAFTVVGLVRCDVPGPVAGRPAQRALLTAVPTPLGLGLGSGLLGANAVSADVLVLEV